MEETVRAQFHEKFKPLFESYRYKIYYGGRAGLKSWSFARALVIRGSLQSLRILCARELQKSIKDSVHQLLKDQISLLKLDHVYDVLKTEITSRENDTRFGFIGLKHNPIELKSWEGADIVWVEEGQAVCDDSWDILIPTIRKENSEIWIGFNPDLEADATYQRFIISPPSNSVVVKVSWRDAKEKGWFPKVLEDEMLDLKERDFNKYLHIWEGDCKRILTGCWFTDSLNKHTQAQQGIIGTLSRTKRDNIFFKDDEEGILEIWRHPYHITHPEAKKWTNRYTIGSDIGEGLNQDYSVAYVLDRCTKQIVARLRSNKVDSVTWAQMLIELARYYTSWQEHESGKTSPQMAFIVPERTGAGITTCKQLLDKGANVYSNMVAAKIGSPLTKQVGWVETRQAKFDILGDLREYMDTTDQTIYDGVLLAECGVFIHDRETGKIGAAEGYNDDCVIGAALTIQGNYVLEPPKQIEPPITGWRAEQEEKGSAWAI